MKYADFLKLFKFCAMDFEKQLKLRKEGHSVSQRYCVRILHVICDFEEMKRETRAMKEEIKGRKSVETE